MFSPARVPVISSGLRPAGRLESGRRSSFLSAVLVAGLLGPAVAAAVTATIPASKDNTLYESSTGAVSNGSGENMFTGRTKDGLIRRALVAFDIAANLPAGSTINSVTLQLNLSRSKFNTSESTTLHRVLADWGEGSSNSSANPGQGASSTANDATWIHRFYPGTNWTTPGGDFAGTASASAGIAGSGFFTWSSAAMAADVQAWLDSPASNFGWLIRGNEGGASTAKRFDTSENAQTTRRPVLTVDYTPPGGGPTGACCYSDTCEVMTSSACSSLSGTYRGDGTTCSPNPCPPPGTATVTLISAHDNTLYQDAAGGLSNGAGTKFIVSKGSGNLLRRGVVQFDLSSIPAGATIQSATLTMYNVEGATNSANVTVHRATASWGEGASVATGTEESGAPATAGDATWIHRFYPGTSWTTAGGDYVATESALLAITAAGPYSWTSTGILADVTAWYGNPATNFGWVVRGKESGAATSVKRFETRESTDPSHRPQLVVTYVAPPPAPTGACCLPDASCSTLSQAQCSAAGGTYQGDDVPCTTGLCPVVLTPYVDALPIPALATPVSGVPGGVASYVMNIREVSQRLHRDLPPTRVWGYGGSYPGPTILAGSGLPVTVTWVNDLRDSSGALRTTHYLPVDLCIHGADMAGPTARVVSHLHGGHVPAAVDGYPDSTLLPGQQTTYVYPNHQDAATLWYHDHALGITRLNVIMGLAGFYLLRDATETALGLPAGEFEIGLAMQDRTFNPDGSFQYPATWMDHFFGDKMLVNGKVWPYLQVKRGKYRFRMLNGCTSRALRVALSNGASFTVIGTEGGLLPAPVTRSSLLITPGERVDVVIDFAPYAVGTQIVLTNDAPAPFPGTPGEGVIPNVMRFDVVAGTGYTASLPAALRPVPPIPASESVLTRDFSLRKISGSCAGSEWLINGLGFDDVTEYPVLGTTEIWRFINDSGVTHPMHMHLVQFQILDRQPFTRVGGEIVTTGPATPPDASEAGWKDTAPVAPNEIVRVIARFEDYAGRYPYHCHILEHEENEMMRQFESVAPPTLSIGDATVTEGNAGTTSASFTVSLSSPVQAPVRVVAYTEDVSATGGTDYTAIPADTLVFPPLTTQRTVTVGVNGDGLVEPDETFRVRLTTPGVAVLGDSIAIGTIVNDDAVPFATVNDVAVTEGNAGTADATFTVSLSAPSAGAVRIVASTEDGTATAGADYTPVVHDTLAFAPFATTSTVTVPVLGDRLDEFDETFRLRLVAAFGAVVGDSTALATIGDDDPEPSLSVSDASVFEGNAGTTAAAFTVSLSARSGKPVRVLCGTRDGTAIAGQDYRAMAPAETLSLAPGDTTLAYTAWVIGETTPESNETFFVDLTSPLYAALGDAEGTITIRDDDGTTDVPGTGGTPLADYLGQGEPNPFTGSLAIRWGLRSPGRAEISVFDVQGRFVRRLAEGWQSAGERTVAWDGRDEGGRAVAIGVYLVRMRSPEGTFKRIVMRLQ
jgi:FtsP/CotA-like multicopper oxidase with cupredoxin domain